MWDVRIDGDALIFRAGFAADSRGGPVQNSLHNTKLIIEALRKRFYPCKLKIVIGNLDKKVNWRYDIEPEYKSNRKLICDKGCGGNLIHIGIQHKEENGSVFRGFRCDKCGRIHKDKKPVYYYDIRKYLIKRYKAFIVKWGETDDWLGVNVTKKTIIVSSDKDLLMIPAFHWRLHLDVGLKVTDPGVLFLEKGKLKGYGFKWFCAQMLLGDTIDHIIKPLKGFGDVKIYHYLDGVKDQTPKGLWNAIKEFYRQSGYDHDTLIKTAKLLWIARNPKELFNEALIEKVTTK